MMLYLWSGGKIVSMSAASFGVYSLIVCARCTSARLASFLLRVSGLEKDWVVDSYVCRNALPPFQHTLAGHLVVEHEADTVEIG